MIAAFISLSIFILGFAGYTFMYGLQPTLSDYYYKSKWWSIWLIACIATAMPAWIDKNPQVQFLAFTGSLALLFVAFAPAFKGHERTIHCVAAVVAAISALVWALFTAWYVPAILIPIMLFLTLRYKEYWGLIVEIITFIGIYFIVLLEY